MFILSSPSGAGKTTLTRQLLEREPELSMSVSVTTRPPRQAEIDGEDYIFIRKRDFLQMRERDDLLENAEVFGHFYGTPKKPVEEALRQGRDVLFDIDWQGTQQLEQKRSGDVVKVFLLPPSAEELRERITRRGQDQPKTLSQRMLGAPDEISHYPEYDYIVVNRDIEESLGNLRAILRAERMRRKRQEGLDSFASALQECLRAQAKED